MATVARPQQGMALEVDGSRYADWVPGSSSAVANKGSPAPVLFSSDRRRHASGRWQARAVRLLWLAVSRADGTLAGHPRI
jgi:hypothetical protein